MVGHARYARRRELVTLARRQEPLRRPRATRAAFIPIRKSGAWWASAQDERRAAFEERSQHIAIGLDDLPAVAKRLHHSRALNEPFDFLTWFEYVPADEPAFDGMLARLRSRDEWRYVEREHDVRLSRGAPAPDA